MRSASGGRDNRSDYSRDSRGRPGRSGSRGRSEGRSPRREDARGQSRESGSHVSGEVIGQNPETQEREYTKQANDAQPE